MSVQHRKLRILVVDDEVVARAMLEDHLRAAGHDVRAVGDATTAVRALEQEKADIVISDWVMPQATGLDLCRKVHERFRTYPPHFVMLTVYAEKERLVEAFEAGVDDFLSKPLHQGELIARLRAWTRTLLMREELSTRHQQAIEANDALASLNK